MVAAGLFGAFFFFLSGPYFLTYILYRGILLRCARASFTEKPGMLFALSVLASYVWLTCTPLAFGVVFAVPYVLSNENKWATDFLLYLLLASIPCGAVGWMVLAVSHFKRSAMYRLYVKLQPAPKFQLWLQDIMIAAFALGLSMTLIVNLGHLIPLPRAIEVIAAYELLTQAVMFFALMDACRRSERLQIPRIRAAYVFGLMFVNAFFPQPILIVLAWNVWRRALFLADGGNLPHAQISVECERKS